MEEWAGDPKGIMMAAHLAAKDEFATFENGLIHTGDVTLYYCDDDMSEMVEMGAQVLTHEDVADTSNVEHPRGFCYFTKAIALSETMKIHALAWAPHMFDDDGNPITYLITAYNDRFNEADSALEGWEQFHSRVGLPVPNFRWVYRATTPYRSGDPMAPTESLTNALSEFTATPVIRVTPSYAFHSLMLMLQQPAEIVTICKKETTNKKQAKRLKGKNIPTEVTIIDIRHKYRSAPSVTGPSDREYSHRWLVVGHWRWQPMKDKETGLAIKKRIWINPYIKGPEDKPFIATKRVHALLK
jgi:hypothetical protein